MSIAGLFFLCPFVSNFLSFPNSAHKCDSKWCVTFEVVTLSQQNGSIKCIHIKFQSDWIICIFVWFSIETVWHATEWVHSTVFGQSKIEISKQAANMGPRLNQTRHIYMQFKSPFTLFKVKYRCAPTNRNDNFICRALEMRLSANVFRNCLKSMQIFVLL